MQSIQAILLDFLLPMRFTVLQALGQNITGLLTFFSQTLKNN